MDYKELNRESRQTKLLRSVIYWITDLTAVMALAAFVVLFFCDRVTITGHSMEPHLTAGDVVLVNHVQYHFADPQRFDVIVFEKENNGAPRKYVKRVIGLPGETVQIINETIYINGSPLTGGDGIGHVTLSGLAGEAVVLGAGEYFVLGDNRDSSEDSRFANIGNVRREEIEGCIWFRVAPFKDLGFISYAPSGDS
ncbi:MAG: signal peptidase I [Lachnospiraceae bacterium]|jgi:signal peptidase I|nr:signal peptidase I [Lachnospiraceae bacterium]